MPRKKPTRPQHLRILRLPEVEQRTGKSRSGIYDGVAKGTFPAPVPLGARAVGWVEEEIDAYLEACVTARDDGTAERSLPLAGLNQRRKAAERSAVVPTEAPHRKPQRKPSPSRPAEHEAARS
jgi:predicted DNA-binding transcriptional regulator AlpA